MDLPSRLVLICSNLLSIIFFWFSVTCMDFRQVGNKRLTVAACQGSYVRFSITDVTALSKNTDYNCDHI